jgi:hypothetical protein
MPTSLEPNKNMIQIQDEFVATVNAGFSRWSHRKPWAGRQAGGHFGRIWSGAYRKAAKALALWGFTDKQIREIIKDADDMAKLERNADA